jgi:hypothetical protein
MRLLETASTPTDIISSAVAFEEASPSAHMYAHASTHAHTHIRTTNQTDRHTHTLPFTHRPRQRAHHLSALARVQAPSGELGRADYDAVRRQVHAHGDGGGC